MGAAVVTHGDAPPVLKAPEHVFDLVALLVEIIVVFNRHFAVLSGREIMVSCLGRAAPHGTNRYHNPDRPAFLWRLEVYRPATRLLCNRSRCLPSEPSPQACRGRRKWRVTCCSIRLSFDRYSGKEPLFKQAGRRAMGFEVRRVDHEPVWFAALSRQGCENPVEHTHPATAHEAIIKRLVRPVRLGRVFPRQSVPDHINDPADNAPVINPFHAMRKRKIGLHPIELLVCKHEMFIHGHLRPK